MKNIRWGTVGGPIGTALGDIRPHLVAVGIFSALLNLLFVAPTLYMLQVYDRVVPSQGLATLSLLTAILFFALATLAFLDRVRSRLLLHAAARLNTRLAPAILDASFGRVRDGEARQLLRDFDTLRGALTGPAMIALFDAPWMPIYILVCAMLSPWIGLLALAGCVLMPALAWWGEARTGQQDSEAQAIAIQSHQFQDSAITNAEAVRALGLRRALVARQMRLRLAMLRAQADVALTRGDLVALTKFARLFLQSAALGLGAWLAVAGKVSPGAIFAASLLIARALQPIEQLVGQWKSLAEARRAFDKLTRLFDADPLGVAPTALPRPKGQVAVDNLVVAAPDRERALLGGVGFALEAGEALAHLADDLPLVEQVRQFLALDNREPAPVAGVLQRLHHDRRTALRHRPRQGLARLDRLELPGLVGKAIDGDCHRPRRRGQLLEHSLGFGPLRDHRRGIEARDAVAAGRVDRRAARKR